MHKIDLFAKCTMHGVKTVPKNSTCIQKPIQNPIFIHFFTILSYLQIPSKFSISDHQKPSGTIVNQQSKTFFYILFSFLFDRQSKATVYFLIQNKKNNLFQKQYRAIMEKTSLSDFMIRRKDAYKTIHNPYESYIVF